MHTPAITLPWCGRVNGRDPICAGAAAMVAPQLEQNRAECGSGVPHLVQ
jgi:hypothetical protein